MKKVPLFDHVGSYGLFFTDEYELKCYLNKKDINNQYKLFFGGTKHDTDIDFVNYISLSKYNNYLHPNLPNWIKDENSFNRCISKEYSEVLPKSAEIITTLNCCFRCEQCSYQKVKINNNLWYEKSNNYSYTFNMNQENVKPIIDKLSSVENVVFTGGGEPLINTNATLLGMKYAKKKGLNVGLYTNGYLLSDSVIENILTIEPLFVRISIYGVDSTSFSNYTNTPKSNYNIVIKNIRSLINKKELTHSKTKIAISFLVHPLLFPQPESIINFFQQTFTNEELSNIEYIRFTPAVNYDGIQQHEYSFFKKICEIVDQLSQKYHNITHFVFYEHRLNDLYTPKEYSACLGNGFFAEVAPNGDMYFCCEKLMDKDYYIGNLIDKSMYDIYHGKLRKEINNRINSDSCDKCPSLCKPHEINKQLNILNNLDESSIQNWRTELMAIAENETIYSGAFNGFES